MPVWQAFTSNTRQTDLKYSKYVMMTTNLTGKQRQKNLPWISVYDPQGATSDYLLKYNVGSLPAMFIINRNGELCERITDLKKIDSTVAKYM